VDWGPDLPEAYCAVEHDLDFANADHGQQGPITVRRFLRPTWAPEQEAFAQACLATGFPSYWI
jgi:hypothetical protein